MAGLLLYMMAALINQHAQHATGRAGWLQSWPTLAAAVAGGLVVWLATCGVVSTLIARRGRHRALAIWDGVAQGIALLAFAGLCFGCGWSALVPGQFLGLLPFVGMLLAHWATMSRAVGAVTGHRWTARGMLIHQLRFSMLPLLLVITLIADLADPLGRWLVPGPISELTQLLGMQALMLLVLLLLPPVLVRVWGARPMPPGATRDHLQEMCDRMGVRVGRLMHWPISGGRVYNAAVLGMVPRLRYVLFTDDLLRDLDQRQLTAVIGHELGHARHAHLWLYYLFAQLTFLGPLIIAELHPGLLAQIEALPMVQMIPADQRALALAVLFILLMWRLVFGVISRACERQADLAGAELAGGCQAMEDALKSVARLSGQPENAPNWRHYSIAQRVDFLARVRATPVLAALHHRLVGSMRFSLILLLLVMVMSLAVNYFYNPTRLALADPSGSLTAMAAKDGKLRKAFAEADAGNPTALAEWYNRADEPMKQLLLEMHLALLIQGDGDGAPDDRALYRMRHRLRAFIHVTSGLPDLDLMLENALAYGLVAGDERPTARDIEQARVLLPRLEKAVKQSPKRTGHGVLDTIGCVHFRLGEAEAARPAGDEPVARHFASALLAFERAAALLAEDTTSPAGQRAEAARLYQQRIEAAMRNRDALLAGSVDQLQPLPLQLSPIAEPAPDAGPPADAGRDAQPPADAGTTAPPAAPLP